MDWKGLTQHGVLAPGVVTRKSRPIWTDVTADMANVGRNDVALLSKSENSNKTSWDKRDAPVVPVGLRCLKRVHSIMRYFTSRFSIGFLHRIYGADLIARAR